MNSYMRMFTDNEIYSAKVTIKSYLNSAVNTIKEKFSTAQLGMFKKTCFGHFLDMHELQFSGQAVNHMLWRQCICDDPNIMVFNFGGSGARFIIQEFCLISGLFCGPIPDTRPTTSRHFRYTYFGGRKFPLHNHDIVEVFSTTLWGYEMISSLAKAFGIKSSLPRCPRMRNWIISGMPKKKILEDIFADGFEVVGVMVPKVHEMPLVATVHHAVGQKPGDATPIVEDKQGVDLDADRVHSLHDKDETGTKKIDARCEETTFETTCINTSVITYCISGQCGYTRCIPSAFTTSSMYFYRGIMGNSVEDRLCAMENKLSSMDSRLFAIDSRQSSIDSRLSSIDSKLDCLVKLLSSTYNTTEVQCFDEVEDEDIGVGDVHRMGDQRIDHTANHIVAPVSISSSPIGVRAGVKHMETVTHLIRQRADKYLEVFNSHILVLDNRLFQYMEARLDIFNENKSNYDFGEEMLEFLNGKEPMMKIKPCWEYD
ncbi:hypothetical protein FNV43_RR04458 [Rhamnella rubrinervis]|uniref:Uncharacterized protein n=1 Tax=Rhamnella rubrinervis TaxID=2594499 RepID=A0A8K0HKB1_9ROSA|nr:hypothetical protein FNV43_RR04458 [Rhamnella rubrinervis]